MEKYEQLEKMVLEATKVTKTLIVNVKKLHPSVEGERAKSNQALSFP